MPDTNMLSFQEVDEEWPLQILDHGGKLHNVFLKPGEMIWWVSQCSNRLFLWKLFRYESAKQVHARAVPLNGSYFENLFVHYMPRSQDWYKSDYNAHYDRPVKYYALEDLQEADKVLEEKIEKEQQQHEDMNKNTNLILWHYSTPEICLVKNYNKTNCTYIWCQGKHIIHKIFSRYLV